MSNVMRESTLQTLGLGNVIGIFQNGRTPADTAGLVDQVFGDPGNRGSLVISGANGIVGAGKAMQLGSRLEPFGVRVVGLDFPSAPDGIGGQYPGLVQAFGREGADRIMGNITRMSYDGTNLPAVAFNRPAVFIVSFEHVAAHEYANHFTFRALGADFFQCRLADKIRLVEVDQSIHAQFERVLGGRHIAAEI